MKSIFVHLFWFACLVLHWLVGSMLTYAQIGIGTATPCPSAQLDVRATDKGFLLPRLTTANRTSLGSILISENNALNDGMQVYDTDTKQIFYWNETTDSWVAVSTGSGSDVTTASNGLTEVGDDVRLGGTLTGLTTIAQAGNNLSLTGSGNFGVGVSVPGQKLDVLGNGRFLSGGAGVPNAIIVGRTAGEAELGVAGGFTDFSNFAGIGDVVIRSNTDDLIITARNATGSIIFGTETPDTEKMRLTNGGNLGIGINPTQRLDVNGASIFRGQLDMNTANRIVNLQNPVNPQDATTKAYVDGLASGTNFIQNQNAVNQTANFRINGTGQIGGNAEINGGQLGMFNATSNWIRFIGNQAVPAFATRSEGTRLILVPTLTGSSVDFAIGVATNEQWYSVSQAISANVHRFYAGTTALMTIRGDGNVGVGQTAPTQRLEVQNGNMLLSNTGTASQLRFQEPNASGTNFTAFQAQAQTADITYTLPASSSNGVLTNTAGTLSWGPRGATSANNGLTLTGNNVKLGGALSENTSISLTSSDLSIEGSVLATSVQNTDAVCAWGLGLLTPGFQTFTAVNDEYVYSVELSFAGETGIPTNVSIHPGTTDALPAIVSGTVIKGSPCLCVFPVPAQLINGNVYCISVSAPSAARTSCANPYAGGGTGGSWNPGYDVYFKVNTGQPTPFVHLTGGTTNRVGIGTDTPFELLSVGSASEFRVNNAGNLTRIRNVSYSWPTTNATGLLTNDGTGNLTWAPGGAGNVTGSGTINAIPRWTGATALGNSTLRDDGTTAAIGATPSANHGFQIAGTFALSSLRTLNSSTTAGASSIVAELPANTNVAYGVQATTLNTNTQSVALYGNATGGGMALKADANHTGYGKVAEFIAGGAKPGGYTGITIENNATSAVASIIKTGVSISSSGAWNGTGSVNTGLNVSVGGGTTNYAALFSGGNVGIGTAAPIAPLHSVEPGTNATDAAIYAHASATGASSATAVLANNSSSSVNAYIFRGQNNGVNRAMITNFGMLGIGNSLSGSPAYHLHIAHATSGADGVAAPVILIDNQRNVVAQTPGKLAFRTDFQCAKIEFGKDAGTGAVPGLAFNSYTDASSSSVGNGTGTNRMFIHGTTGNLGIGTGVVALGARVDIRNNASDPIQTALSVSNLNTNALAHGLLVNTVSAAGATFLAEFRSNAVPRMVVMGDGLVGIGTSAPLYPLDISGSLPSGGTGGGRYFNSTTALTAAGANAVVSVRATGAFWSTGAGLNGGFYASSDQRIKNIIGISNSQTDLETVMKLQVTDYTFKDTLAKGNGSVKGVIAQQIEAVYPQAISKQTNWIPNIYQLASDVVYDSTNQTLFVTLNQQPDLKAGDRIRLVTLNNSTIDVAVSTVEDRTFTVVGWKENVSKLFVFGKEVTDFQIVDYDRLHTLGLSAIQELAKREAALQTEIQSLKAENAMMKTKLEDTQQQVNNTTTQLDAKLDEVLKRLQKVENVTGTQAQR